MMTIFIEITNLFCINTAKDDSKDGKAVITFLRFDLSILRQQNASLLKMSFWRNKK